ncbi:alpha-glucosidase [Pseudarcicella hirudinis]|uniref:Alpha-glucosidase n=2 Tax=Pseudarcicella hirudinis TaxID=1079859 RepID=A0A1I5WAC7_9BACT|nr:glycoside hydrolase family 97 protein [Pseudarcicella hirudinis]SFQ16641.1 alpha-glucosidase [Pseudarcicella hirudinis]
MWKFIFCLSFLLTAIQQTNAQIKVLEETRTEILSPDKKLLCRFYQQKEADGRKRLFYEVFYQKKPVVLPSELDIRLDNHLTELAMALKVDKSTRWCEDLLFKKKESFRKDSLWKPVYGERSVIRDNFEESIITFEKEQNPDYQFQIRIKVYNAGVAIQYYFPENPKGSYYQITGENTQFTFEEGTRAYYARWAQAPYHEMALSDWPDEGERPLTLQLKNGLYACLAEAGMIDYARTKFKLSKEKANTIETSLYSGVDGISYFGTPWRVIMVAETPGELIENNDIILNLNEPAKIKNPDWIKPGKIIREMTLTTEGAKAAIDFAEKRNLQYILFDWKWYGPALTWDSDATQVKAKMDMAEIVEYGRKKNVGIWLYVNQQALLKQADEIFPLYKKWGIKGVKFGFVQVGSHRWTTWLQEAIRKCAENQLMVNIHDDYRPTGEQRTFPNLMTAEGIRGNEEMPDATHNTILPFTRYIAGAADYTICYFDKRIKTTHAHQLALAAVYYSPIQTLYWYDKPALYEGEPEVEFFDKIPTSWDETKVVQGKVGAYITTARRSGQDWFVGTITNNEARNLKVPLAFLEKGKQYKASVYEDDPAVSGKTKVKITRIDVDANTVLDLKLLASGGQAIWISLKK